VTSTVTPATAPDYFRQLGEASDDRVAEYVLATPR
jgi:hypothetical protein